MYLTPFKKLKYLGSSTIDDQTDYDHFVAAVMQWLNNNNTIYVAVFPRVHSSEIIKVYRYKNKDCDINCYCYSTGVLSEICKSHNLPIIDTFAFTKATIEILNIITKRRWDMLVNLHPRILYYLMLIIKSKFDEKQFVSDVIYQCALCSDLICLNNHELGIKHDNSIKMWTIFGFPLFPSTNKIENKDRMCDLMRIIQPNTLVTREQCLRVLQMSKSLIKYDNKTEHFKLLFNIQSTMINIYVTLNSFPHEVAKKCAEDSILILLSIYKKQNLLTPPIYLFPITAIFKAGQFISNLALQLGFNKRLPVEMFRCDLSLLQSLWDTEQICDSVHILSDKLFGRNKTPPCSITMPSKIHKLYELLKITDEDYYENKIGILCPECLDIECTNIRLKEPISLQCGHKVCVNCWTYASTQTVVLCPVCKINLDTFIYGTIERKKIFKIEYITESDIYFIDNLIHTYHCSELSVDSQIPLRNIFICDYCSSNSTI